MDELSMADLAYALIITGDDERYYEANAANQWLEQVRQQARAPHAVTWIELDFRARASRAMTEYEAKMDLGIVPDRIGYLIEQHPQVPSRVKRIT